MPYVVLGWLGALSGRLVSQLVGQSVSRLVGLVDRSSKVAKQVVVMADVVVVVVVVVVFVYTYVQYSTVQFGNASLRQLAS